MRIGLALLAAALAMGQPQQPLKQQPLKQTAPVGEAGWREDLKIFAEKFGASGMTVDFQRGPRSRGQKDFEKLYPPAMFHAEMERLNSEAGKLSDEEMTLALMKLVASGNVAHTMVGVGLKFHFFGRLPLTLAWYPDGLGVIEASQEYSNAIGARVVRIGKMTPDEALAAIGPYAGHETDAWQQVRVPQYLVTRAMLDHLGLLGPDLKVEMTFQKPNGQPFMIDVRVADPRTAKLKLADVMHVETPLYLSQSNSYYWYRYLPESQTFYIQYNRCADDPKLRFSDFVRMAMADADMHAAQHGVRRMVIDLRLNGGGDSRVLAPLKKALAARAKKLGPVYGLIGPGTFSSGLMAAIDLRNDLHATLVGSPSAEKLNSYGEVMSFTLPNSKLVVQYSTKYFHLAKEGQPDLLIPDIPAPPTFADALTGRDAALEAAISDANGRQAPVSRARLPLSR